MTKWYAPTDGSFDKYILEHGKKDDVVVRVPPNSEKLKLNGPRLDDILRETKATKIPETASVSSSLVR